MKGKLKFQTKCVLCLIPAVLGVTVFYLAPFFRILYYSFIKNQFHREFVGFRNYAAVMTNPYYQLALRNTLLMIVICVPLYLVISLAASFLIVAVPGRERAFRTAFVLPVVLPTASIVFVLRILLAQSETPLPVYLLFLWKYLGYGLILFSAALSTVSKEVYEAAKLDGATWLQGRACITLPMIRPVTCFVGLLATVFCFRIYRDSRLFYGTDYPPEYSYTLQYYMNNHFQKLNYQNLAVSAVLTTLFVAGCLVLVLLWKKRERGERR